MNKEINIKIQGELLKEEDIKRLFSNLAEAMKDQMLMVRNPLHRWWKFWQPKYL